MAKKDSENRQPWRKHHRGRRGKSDGRVKRIRRADDARYEDDDSNLLLDGSSCAGGMRFFTGDPPPGWDPGEDE